MQRKQSILLLACFASRAFLSAQNTPSMPTWLSPYPGADEQTRRLGPLVESSYTAAAPPRDVLSHFRQLFAAAGMPFQPSAAGNGFMIRASPPECDLFIRIRRMEAGTAVQVTCSAGTGRDQAQRTLAQAGESHHDRINSMEKYDRPVYPQPKRPVPPMPPLAWPPWLLRIDGERLDVQKGIDGVMMHYLKSSFLCALPRNDIQTYYADLLNSNGYPVSLRSLASTPKDRKAWVEGAQYLEGRAGRRFVIRIDLTPADDLVTVELRMTAYP
jgi:hypothetical protein